MKVIINDTSRLNFFFLHYNQKIFMQHKLVTVVEFMNVKCLLCKYFPEGLRVHLCTVLRTP
jgi:hypothetical protein